MTAKKDVDARRAAPRRSEAAAKRGSTRGSQVAPKKETPKSITYFAGGRLRRLPLQGLFESRQSRDAVPGSAAFRAAPQHMGRAIAATLAHEPRLTSWYEEPNPEAALLAPVDKGRTSVICTGAVVIESATSEVVKAFCKEHGAELVREGRQGKVMVRLPGDPLAAVPQAAKLSVELVRSGRAPSAYPNFVRVLQRPDKSQAIADHQWNLDNPGTSGLIGADVHALAAWTITEGVPEVAVAVLDEGVDTNHRMLRQAIRAEADFVDRSKADAHPVGDDAHGTACAGIVASRDANVRGVAPGVALVAARIARGDGRGFWIFDDFETADAFDWCWEEGGADVLSNSWVGAAPSDAIINAIRRARQKGRSGKGTVVVFAAGNTQGRIGFPGDVEGVLVVGASNQWDERKTHTSQDGELEWGSNHGPELDLMAPGVSILTTDISGEAGYSRTETTGTFNGTSAATPHVAAAAALLLSKNPDLPEARVREILCSTAEPIGRTAVRNDHVGHGRLNCYAALRAARRG